MPPGGIELLKRVENRTVGPLGVLAAVRRDGADARAGERSAKLGKQPALADARLARDQHEAPVRAARLAPPLVEVRELRVTTNQFATNDGLCDHALRVFR
jgi:hypothetical protein